MFDAMCCCDMMFCLILGGKFHFSSYFIWFVAACIFKHKIMNYIFNDYPYTTPFTSETDKLPLLVLQVSTSHVDWHFADRSQSS